MKQKLFLLWYLLLFIPSVVQAKIHLDVGQTQTLVCHATPPNPLSLELPDLITFFEGRTIQMPLQIYPSDAYAQIAWSSSDETVAKVNDRGLVSLLKSGTAVIRATAQNGVSASCLLTVKFPTNYLLLWLKDGRQEQYRLQTHPRVTYADGQLWVHSRLFS